MANRAGGLSFPLAAPVFAGDSIDPALGMLGKALPPIMRAYLGEAFQSTGTSFDIIQAVYYFDPKAVYDGQHTLVDDSTLPALYLFGRHSGSTRLTDSHQEIEREISVFWCPPSRTLQDNSQVDQLFGPFSALLGLIVQKGRDIAWIDDSDQGEDQDPIIDARKTAAQAAGSDILAKCGFSRWTQLAQSAVTRDYFSITGGLNGNVRYDGFLAKITAYELVEIDPQTEGVVPTSLVQSFNTGPPDPYVTGGFIKRPAS